MNDLKDLNTDDADLKAAVKTFFNDFLNYYEESDSGREFHPIHISCCRCMMTGPLNETLDKMRKLSGADPKPKLNVPKEEEDDDED